MRGFIQKHRLESVAGVLYGVECSEPHIVPVPIHSGYEKIRRPIDLYHRFYVHTLNTCHNRVSKYEEYTMDVGTWPKDSNSGAKYVIYVSNGVRNAGLFLPDRPTLLTVANGFKTGGGSNHLIRSLAGGKNLIQKGNVLVVKTDLEGVVCDVRYKDLRVVSDMVVKYANYLLRWRSELIDPCIFLVLLGYCGRPSSRWFPNSGPEWSRMSKARLLQMILKDSTCG